GHEHQFGRARGGGAQTEEEGCAGSPYRSPCPEYVAAPPVESVGTESAEGQCHGKSHAHRMQRMPPESDLRLGLLISRVLLDRIDQIFTRVLRHRLGHRGRLFPGISCLTMLVALSGCAERLSAVHPAGPAADIIATLWWVMLAGA